MAVAQSVIKQTIAGAAIVKVLRLILEPSFVRMCVFGVPDATDAQADECLSNCVKRKKVGVVTGRMAEFDCELQAAREVGANRRAAK